MYIICLHGTNILSRKEPHSVVLNCQTVIRLWKSSDLLIYDTPTRHDRHSLTVISLSLLPSCGHRLNRRCALNGADVRLSLSQVCHSKVSLRYLRFVDYLAKFF